MKHRFLRLTVSPVPLALLMAIFLALVLLGTVAAQAPVTDRQAAAEWRVCKTGHSSCDFATIQDAINAAQDGDTIKVAGGVYNNVHEQPWAVNSLYPFTPTQVAFISKTLTIRGGYAAGSWDKAVPASNPTTVDAMGQGRGIYIVALRDVTLENLQVVNGHGEHDETGAPRGGGGIGAEDYYSGTLTIRNCEILSNTATGDGAGLYFRLGVLVLTNSRVVSNTSTQLGGGLYVRDAQVTLTGNKIERNISASQGGGLNLYESTAYVARNTFRANRSDWDGGAVRATWGNVEFEDNTVIYNVADGRGGGLQVDLGAGNTYTMTGNFIKGNLACADENGQGGGVSVSNGSGWLVFSENQVISNTASQDEDGRGYGGGLSLHGPALVSNNLFQGNLGCTGPGCGGIGGGLSLKGNVWLERNRILDNVASTDACDGWCAGDNHGGGIAVHNQSRVTMTNNIIAGNEYGETLVPGKDNTGGAIYLGGQTDPQDCVVIAYHNTIADNQSPAILNESAGLELSHTILSGHSLDIETVRDTSGLGPVPVTNLDFTLWWPSQELETRDGSVINTSNDMVGDPVFMTLGGDDYHIGSGSAAEDRGPGIGVDIDIDGMRRPNGGAFDVGADENLRMYLPLLRLSWSLPAE